MPLPHRLSRILRFAELALPARSLVETVTLAVTRLRWASARRIPRVPFFENLSFSFALLPATSDRVTFAVRNTLLACSTEAVADALTVQASSHPTSTYTSP